MLSLLRVDSDTARCRRCKEPITLNQWAMSLWNYGLSTGPAATEWIHPRCAVDVWPEYVPGALNMTKDEFEGRDEIEALVTARLRGKFQLDLARREAKKKGVAAVIPMVEPARDPKGRPRVRLYWAGSFVTSSHAGMEEFSMLARDLTITSALREYVLMQFLKVTKKSLDDDPSQPLIGAVYAALSSVRLVGAQKERLAAWKAENLPVPLLWVIDAANDQSLVDARVLELRTALDSVGYVGDEAQVLVTHAMDESVLEALGRALDEAIGFDGLHAQTADPGKRAAERLHEVVEGNDREAFVATLDIAAKSLRGTHQSVKSQLIEDATKTLSHPTARVSALKLLLLLSGVPAASRDVATSAVKELVREVLDAPGLARSYPPEFALAMEVLEKFEYRPRWSLLLSAFTSAKITATRLAKLTEYLVQCDDEAVLAALTDATEKLSEKDEARKEHNNGVRAKIQANVDALEALKKKKKAEALARKSKGSGA